MSDQVYALAYERVSTEEQADSNNSIPAQRRRIEAYAASHGATILEHYADAGASAYKDDENRVQFWAMIERAKQEKRVGLILVDDATRFYRHRARAVMLKHELRRHGVQVVSVQVPYDPDTIHGLWMEGIDEIRAQAASMETAYNTMRAMEQNAMTRDPESGWCYKNGGKPPYGYEAYRIVRGRDSRGKDITKTLWRINPEQAEVIRLILLDLRLTLRLSLDEIRDELNQRGIKPPRGKWWVTTCIYEFCRPERVLAYAGVYFWNKEDHRTQGVRFKPKDKWLRVDNAHPAVITLEEAEAVTSLQADLRRERSTSGRALRSPYLLTGRAPDGDRFFVCAKCGGSMVGYHPAKRSRYKYICSTLLTRGWDKCVRKPLDRDPLEQAVIDHAVGRFTDEECVERFIDDLRDIVEYDREMEVTARRSIEKRVTEIQAEIDRVVDMAIKGQIDGAVSFERTTSLRVERDALRKQLETMRTYPPFDAQKVRELCSLTVKVLTNPDHPERKEFLRKVVRRLEFDPDKNEVRVYTYQAPLHSIHAAGLNPDRVLHSAGARDET